MKVQRVHTCGLRQPLQQQVLFLYNQIHFYKAAV